MSTLIPLGNGYYGIEVPEDAFQAYEHPTGTFGYMTPGPADKFYSEHNDIDLPEGKWEMVGLVNSLNIQEVDVICAGQPYQLNYLLQSKSLIPSRTLILFKEP